MQGLLEVLLGRPVVMKVFVDNTQAIAAAKTGYSKKLRHLSRSHRVSIGTINELVEDAEAYVVIEYKNTKEQRADLFTKALDGPAFLAARNMIGLIALPKEISKV